MSRARSSVSSPHRSPVSIAVSTRSCASESGSAAYKASNCAAVMIFRGFFGTGSVFTPRLGCAAITPSCNAVVKIALRTEPLAYSIRRGRTPRSLRAVIHSRTCSEPMSRIFIGPKNHMMCLPITEPVVLPRRHLQAMVREPRALDVVLEGLPPPGRVVAQARADGDLGRLPRRVGIGLSGERARGSPRGRGHRGSRRYTAVCRPCPSASVRTPRRAPSRPDFDRRIRSTRSYALDATDGMDEPSCL